MKVPAFQFYPDDFIGGTVEFSAEEIGAYIRLLCYQWGHGSIPSTTVQIDRVAGCPVTATVLSKFPSGKNPRMEAVRKKQLEFSKAQSLKGKASVAARLKSGSNPNSTLQSPSPSPMLRESYAERASLEEVAFFADKIGLARWKAEDWFHEMEGCGWLDHNRRPVDKWQSILTRVKIKWEADGRPKGPPSNANNGKPRQQSVDRNQGTANANCIGQYDGMGKVPPIQS